jgi:hypothetical protein
VTVSDSDWVPFTFEGRDGYRLDFMAFVPIGDPRDGSQAGASVIFACPPQGRASFTAIAKGDPGEPPEWRNITPVAVPWDHPDPLTADADIGVPGSPGVPAKWDLTFEVPRGEPGDPGDMAFDDLTDVFGTAAEGYVPAFSTDADGAGGDGLVYTSMGHGGQYWPSSISNTTAANGQLRTVAQASVPALPFAWRPRVFGACIISGTVNTRPHLIARLADATTGAIVGRGFAVPSIATQNVILQSGVPAGSANDYGVIEAGVGPTTIFLRAEEQASTVDNYTTSSTTTSFYVEAAKVI